MTTPSTPSPGVYKDISFPEYCSWPAVNHSTLRHMDISPAHCRQYMLHGNQQTRSLRLGQAAHTAVLEPKKFEDDYFVIPFVEDARADKDHPHWKGKEYSPCYVGEWPHKSSNQWKEHVGIVERDNAGKILLPDDEYDEAMNIRRAVQEHVTARQIIDEPGLPEVCIVWKDEETGLMCKARIDKLVPSRVIEIKSSDDARDFKFARAIERYSYHTQAAWYLLGLNALDIAGKREEVERQHIFIVIENKPPHAVMCYQLDHESLTTGHFQNRNRLAEYSKCLAEDYWPAFPDHGIQPIGLH